MIIQRRNKTTNFSSKANVAIPFHIFQLDAKQVKLMTKTPIKTLSNTGRNSRRNLFLHATFYTFCLFGDCLF
jgi:hypothetical protein